jgi:hypothetical protein
VRAAPVGDPQRAGFLLGQLGGQVDEAGDVDVDPRAPP